jgi:uncharacterized protein (DUF1800 family)
VAENPPQSLVDRLAAVFMDTDGDLRALSRALVQSDEAWEPEPVKVVPPYDFVVTAMRVTGATLKPPTAGRVLGKLGQPVWMPPSPEGWPDEDEAWLLPDGLVERVDWAWDLARHVPPGADALELADAVLGASLDAHTRQTIARAESREQGLVLLLMSSQLQRR